MAESALRAWLRLTLTPGLGAASQRALLSAFGLPEQIFATGLSRLSKVVSAKQAQALINFDDQAALDGAEAWAQQPGNHIIPLGDPNYPKTLLETVDPPTLLYVKGRLELLNRSALAMVGSRNATGQGMDNAEAFAHTLASGGLTIVSGLAQGIDTAAHRGALQASGPEHGSTIAVIGTGADRIYPASNRELALRIAEHGVIVSEFPLGTPALAANFPRRNRIISGMAQGVLVVEAAERSGSLITARLAGEQGRDVFAIPGSIHSPLSKGCHYLIKQGAKLVDNAKDILDELLPMRPFMLENAPEPTPALGSMDPVLHAIGFDPCTLETLSARTGISPQQLSSHLLQLELQERITVLPGGRYQQLPAR